MEKISQIVRGNARVAAVDLKSAPAVRPGAPSFGRTIGESPGSFARETTTASRASALHAQLADSRRASSERVIDQMADQFFMGRMRRPDDSQETAPAVGAEAPLARTAKEANAMINGDDDSSVTSDSESPADTQPVGYKPRGSYLDVRA